MTLVSLPNNAETRAFITAVVRSWQSARHAQLPTLPALYSTLNERGFGMMPLTFDSLLHTSEVCLNRRLMTGTGQRPTADEELVIDLVFQKPMAQASVILQSRPEMVQIFGSTLRATHIMLSMQLPRTFV